MEKNTVQHKSTINYLSFLSTLAAVLWITCIVSQDRLVSIYIGYISAAVLPYPFLCILFDIIAELYGYKEARKTLWLAFISIYIFVISVYIFSKLPAPGFWDGHVKAFNAEMNPLLRILIFNSISFMIGQYVNVYIFSKLRFLFRGRFFGVRSIASTFIGDTITFAIALFGDFSGMMKNHQIILLVIDELLLVYLMAIILAIPASIIVSLLKKVEPEANVTVTFNPFK